MRETASRAVEWLCCVCASSWSCCIGWEVFTCLIQGMKGAIKGEAQMDYTFGRRDLGERKREREGRREGGRGNCPKWRRRSSPNQTGVCRHPLSLREIWAQQPFPSQTQPDRVKERERERARERRGREGEGAKHTRFLRKNTTWIIAQHVVSSGGGHPSVPSLFLQSHPPEYGSQSGYSTMSVTCISNVYLCLLLFLGGIRCAGRISLMGLSNSREENTTHSKNLGFGRFESKKMSSATERSFSHSVTTYAALGKKTHNSIDTHIHTHLVPPPRSIPYPQTSVHPNEAPPSNHSHDGVQNRKKRDHFWVA